MGLKNGLVSTVTLRSGYCRNNAESTGTVMATSPMAERRMIRICKLFSFRPGFEALGGGITFVSFLLRFIAGRVSDS